MSRLGYAIVQWTIFVLAVLIGTIEAALVIKGRLPTATEIILPTVSLVPAMTLVIVSRYVRGNRRMRENSGSGSGRTGAKPGAAW